MVEFFIVHVAPLLMVRDDFPGEYLDGCAGLAQAHSMCLCVCGCVIFWGRIFLVWYPYDE